jgi:hypothetical protein
LINPMKSRPASDKLKAAPSGYEEERIPFDQVLRKLVSTKPAHKVAPAPVKRGAKKPPKKA